MNKYNNKKYYWIKLQTDFFNQETIDFLLSQKNGCEYIVLYQMLCLKTANNNGLLSTNIGEMIVPYDIDKIVRDTKYFDFDTVTIALGLFKKLGLIYEQEDKILKISDIDNMVGSITQNALYKQKSREKKLLENVKVNSNKILDIRDKSIDIDNNIKENNNISNDILLKENKKDDNAINFEIFWQRYPRKIGKANAQKWWNKHKPNEKMFNAIMIGLENQLENKSSCLTRDKQYIPYPSSWLNGMRWEDELTIDPKKETTEEMVIRLSKKLREEGRIE